MKLTIIDILIITNLFISSRGIDTYIDLSKGLVLEPYGAYLSHYGFSYIPLSFSIPTELRESMFPSCIDFRKIKSHHDQVIHYLKNVIPVTATTKRPKRWLPLISGLMGSGIAIWNRVSIASLESKINAIHKNLEGIHHTVKDLVNTTNTMLDYQVLIHHVISDVIHTLNILTDKSTCAYNNNIQVSLWESSWAGLIVNMFIRAVGSSLSGKITPDLITSANLHDLLTKDESFHNSLYKDDNTLVYELGSFIPSVISSSPPVIIGIMILPKLSHTSSGHVYTVNTVPWIHDGYGYKLDKSGTVVISGNKFVWQADPIECIIRPGLVICPKKFFFEGQDICLTDLLQKNKTNNCRILVKSLPLQAVGVQLKSGVLVGGFDSGTVSIVKQLHSVELVSIPVESQPSPRFMNQNSGTLLMIGISAFQLTELSHPYDYQLRYLTLNITTTQIPLIKIPEWTHIDKVKNPPELIDELSNHDIIIYSIIIILLGITIIVVSIKYKPKCICSKPKPIRRHNDIKMSSLH